MAAITDNARTSWKVDSQVSGVGPDARGAITTGYTINFTTGEGNKGTVFVPAQGYTAAKAIEIIRAHAQELDQVSRSGS